MCYNVNSRLGDCMKKKYVMFLFALLMTLFFSADKAFAAKITLNLNLGETSTSVGCNTGICANVVKYNEYANRYRAMNVSIAKLEKGKLIRTKSAWIEDMTIPQSGCEEEVKKKGSLNFCWQKYFNDGYFEKDLNTEEKNKILSKFYGQSIPQELYNGNYYLIIEPIITFRYINGSTYPFGPKKVCEAINDAYNNSGLSGDKLDWLRTFIRYPNSYNGKTLTEWNVLKNYFTGFRLSQGVGQYITSYTDAELKRMDAKNFCDTYESSIYGKVIAKISDYGEPPKEGTPTNISDTETAITGCITGDYNKKNITTGWVLRQHVPNKYKEYTRKTCDVRLEILPSDLLEISNVFSGGMYLKLGSDNVVANAKITVSSCKFEKRRDDYECTETSQNCSPGTSICLPGGCITIGGGCTTTCIKHDYVPGTAQTATSDYTGRMDIGTFSQLLRNISLYDSRDSEEIPINLENQNIMIYGVDSSENFNTKLLLNKNDISVYSSNGIGEIRYTNCAACKFLGYGKISRLNENGSHEIHLKYEYRLSTGDSFKSIDYNDPIKGQCPYTITNEIILPPPGGGTPERIALEFRTVDVYDPFPGMEGEGRDITNSNWDILNWELVFSSAPNSQGIVPETGNRIEPKYSIELTPTDITNIRDYNKTHDYDDYNFKCNDDAMVCISEYLTGLYDNGKGILQINASEKRKAGDFSELKK